MLTMMNNPPRWLAKVLAIVEGIAAPAITTEVHQTVDVMQNGHGFAVRKYGRLAGAVGSITSMNLPETEAEVSDEFAFLVRISLRNPGSGGVTLDGSLSQVPSAGTFPVVAFSATAAAGDTLAWQEFSGGQQYLYIPPNCQLALALGSFAAVAGDARWELVRVPANTKAW